MFWIRIQCRAAVMMVLISMYPKLSKNACFLMKKIPEAQSNEILKVMVPCIRQVTNSWQSSLAYLFYRKDSHDS